MHSVFFSAASAELERLRSEVHGTHLELGGLQQQLQDKECVLQRALAEASAAQATMQEAVAAAAAEARARREAEGRLKQAEEAVAAAESKVAVAEGRAAAAEGQASGMAEEQTRQIRAAGELRAQVCLIEKGNFPVPSDPC